MALLERIAIDPDALAHKMLVGRLYNAGAKLCELHAAFGHDNRTVKIWGDALKSGNMDTMVKAFGGRGNNKKRSPELIRYMQQLYRSRDILGRNYRERIIRMTEEVFAVKVSPSLASAIFKGADDPLEDDDSGAGSESEIESTSGQLPDEPDSESSSTVQASPILPFLAMTAFMLSGNNTLIQHAGLGLFGLWLRLYQPIERQLICQLLQGAVNIEQSKSICHASVAYFSEQPVVGLRAQRRVIDQQASLENTMRLYRQNADLLADGPNRGKLYYMDPHTKEYTGQLKVLKGWCGRHHSISKVVNLDCFHTRSGRPCFIQHYSPYYDMRERFFMSLTLFDQLFDADKRKDRTFVIDRAIYGRETLARFQDDRVITWEKGYRGDAWNPDADSLRFTRARCKNHCDDQKFYRFNCQEMVWKVDPEYRRIIVRASRDGGKEIEVSILCNNPDMDVQDIIWAIFNRWLQENDFKYLDIHFGINQLDSRAHTTFETEADSFQDRPVDCPAYKELKGRLRSVEQRLAQLLLKQHKAEKEKARLETTLGLACKRAEKHIDKLNTEIDRLNDDTWSGSLTPTNKENVLISELRALKRKRQAVIGKLEKLQNALPLLEQEAQELADLLSEAIRKQSRLQLMIDGRYQLLDLRRKAYMDALRVNAANQFHNLHETYRNLHGNYRDDHVRLRMLTRCSGFLSRLSGKVRLQLWVPGSIQPYIIRNMQKFVEDTARKINQTIDSGTPQLEIGIITGPING